MRISEAVGLLDRAVRGRGGIWADLGAGGGTFTRALAELLDVGSTIYAVDRDADVLAELRPGMSARSKIIPVVADFAKPLELPGLKDAALDGLLLANALHFVPDAERVLSRLVTLLRPGGRVVLVEYDRRAANRYVPHPITRAHLPALAAAAGLGRPIVIASRPSLYQGTLYSAYADLPGSD